ncbi:cerebellin-2-like [Daphnia carinata]|uniref:cerebellin-2-like n=1 Tax=Daphnia carinata TaxID=120202 RepID=UPI0028691410|nr:cerebellin-2-like [Daphnia carinata]
MMSPSGSFYYCLSGRKSTHPYLNRITTNEKRLTYLERKKADVYFSVYRHSSFETQNAVIPFQAARLNIGNAMDIETGIFTAPRAGIYTFHFNGFKHNHPMVNCGASSHCFFFNGQYMGRTETGKGTKMGTLSYSTILELKADDEVTLKLLYGIIHDSGNLHIRFSGALLKEL